MMFNLDEKMMTEARSNTSLLGEGPAAVGLMALDDGFVYFDSKLLSLPPKERGVLHLLVREWPKTVSKDQFAQTIWLGQTMSDESLARCVAQIRQIIPSRARTSIQSVYRHGYRLLHLPLLANPEPPLNHPRLLRDAMASPQSVEALTYARQLMQQRTPIALQRAELLLRDLIAKAPYYLAARLAFAECIACTFSSGLAVQRKHLIEGLAQLKELQSTTSDMPGLYAETAHLLDCAWRFDEAATLHAQALQHCQEDVATHYYRGWHLLATAHPREAVLALRAASSLNPFSVNVTILLARALAFAGEPQAGLEQMQQAHEAAPENQQLHAYFLAYQAYLCPLPYLVRQVKTILLGAASWTFAASSIAYVLARCGRSMEAMHLVHTKSSENASLRANYIGPLLVLGEHEEAMRRALAASNEGCGQLPLILLAPENAALRKHPKYENLQRMIPHGALV